jgi:hypothetical protein
MKVVDFECFNLALFDKCLTNVQRTRLLSEKIAVNWNDLQRPVSHVCASWSSV